MKSLPKLIRRFVGLLLLSAALLLALNLLLLAGVVSRQTACASPWTQAEETAAALRKTETGYELPAGAAAELRAQGAWAMLIEDGTLDLAWHSEDLPESVPRRYTAADVAQLTRGYIDGYPTFPAGAEGGLLVLGYPRDRFWKHMWPSWDYWLIANAPRLALGVLAGNALLLFAIYLAANTGLLRSVRPIAEGIRTLPTGEETALPETGLLSELAADINRSSRLLRAQARRLRERESARANWIAGVSHDLRTPLALVMGTAGQLESDPALPAAQRERAAAILRQSRRMGELIGDLNLASRLEYDMQPLRLRRENAVALVRQAAVDCINAGADESFRIEWRTEEGFHCFVDADGALLKRAVVNLIQNSFGHNPGGCAVYVSVAREGGSCLIRVEDDGVGAAEERLAALNAAPLSAVRAWDGPDPPHGLGLLLVRQIAAAHGGEAVFGRSAQGGFAARLRLPAKP